MEVAGLAVGVIPILAATLQQYGTLYKCCKRYKNRQAGIDELLRHLKTQETIFVNETKLLLAAVLGADEAKAMFLDSLHSAWSSKITEHRLQVVLGDSEEAFRIAAQEIEQKMKSVETEIKKMEISTDCKSVKEYRKVLRSKFKFAFSESRLEKLSNAVRRATKTYRTLRAQIQESASYIPKADTDSRIAEQLESFKKTQMAAKRVYEILAGACNLHTKHHAHFSIEPIQTFSSTTTEIQFQIAYRHLSQQQVQGTRDTLWFVIESIANGSIQQSTTTIAQPSGTSNSQKSQKRSNSPMTEFLQQSVTKRGKRVRFQSPPPTIVPTLSSSTLPACQSLSVTTQLPPEPHIKTDFCTQLRNCCTNGQSAGSCIGWLEYSTQWKHRVLHCSGPCKTVSSSASDMSTLAMLLSPNRSVNQNKKTLTVSQRLRLARLLSTAVLNYYGTPWMQAPWSSNDIVIYQSTIRTNSSHSQNQPDAFLEVPVNPNLNATGQSSSSVDPLSPFVHNTTLFALGVILLELAFEKPLQSMRTSADDAPGMPAIMTDFYTAFRQSKENPSVLGIKYATIVEKCLRCDFGQGSDLDNPNLQQAIHRDVIGELDRLETGLRQLGIT